MKKIFLYLFVSLNCYGGIKEKDSTTKKTMFLIRNGMVQNIQIKELEKKTDLLSLNKKNDSLIHYSNLNGDSFHSRSDILIKFKITSLSYIIKLEKKYALKKIKQLSIGDYLFKNIGKNNTVDLINRIIKNEKQNIIRIYPNKILNYIKR